MRNGFTLIELVMVISIISVIAGTVFIGVDPARRLAAARNASRWADVTTLLEAIKKYQFDHDGVLPSLDTDALTTQIVGKGNVDCRAVRCQGQEIVEENCFTTSFTGELRPYLKALPEDPKTGTPEDTRYYVNRDAYGIVSVGACDEEGEERGGKGTPPAIEISR